MLETAKDFSKEILVNLRESLKENFNKDFCIVAVGSFAREEASESSDLDYFLIADDNVAEETIEKIKEVVGEIVRKSCGSTGTFETGTTIAELTSNLGGVNDSNEKLTRRMLFLLEGTYLYNDTLFKEYRKQLIECYIKEDVSESKTSTFLLNDIIRFYRTMATDFEHKTTEQKKPAKVRNIKLTFSRKLLYLSGIVVFAETVTMSREEKIERTLFLLEEAPLSRIEHIFDDKADKALELYSYFLEEISTEPKRNAIASGGEEFRALKDRSKEFSSELLSMLKERYDDDHPIHLALIF